VCPACSVWTSRLVRSTVAPPPVRLNVAEFDVTEARAHLAQLVT
jgi:hypothetical protein